MEPKPRKLLDQVRDALRIKQSSIRTEQAYVNWIKRFILFHHKRHSPRKWALRKQRPPLDGSAPLSIVLIDWLSSIAARFRLSPQCTAHVYSERIGAPRPGRVLSPATNGRIDRQPWRDVVGKHTPGASTPHDGDNGMVFE